MNTVDFITDQDYEQAQAAMEPFEAKVRQVLVEAGFEEGVMSPDLEQARAGFTLTRITPWGGGRCYVEVQRYDWPGADLQGWIKKYSEALDRANLEHEVNDDVDPDGEGWADIHVYTPEATHATH